MHLVVFDLDEQRFALRLEAVERVLPAAAVTPLPGAPAQVLGVLDLGGEILPVLSPRRRFGLPQPAIAPEHLFLIARTAARRVILALDARVELLECAPDAVVAAAPVAGPLAGLPGIVSREDGLVLIHDLEQFLDANGTQRLEAALAGAPR